MSPWSSLQMKEREREMFYLTTHSTHFIYGYMASDIWLRTILIVRKETRCHHIGYSYRLTARVLLYAPSHRQDNTYHSLCYTSHGALAGMRNSSMGPPHEGSIRRPPTNEIWLDKCNSNERIIPCSTNILRCILPISSVCLDIETKGTFSLEITKMYHFKIQIIKLLNKKLIK